MVISSQQGVRLLAIFSDNVSDLYGSNGNKKDNQLTK